MKILLLGEVGVGKTTLLSRLAVCTSFFSSHTHPPLRTPFTHTALLFALTHNRARTSRRVTVPLTPFAHTHTHAHAHDADTDKNTPTQKSRLVTRGNKKVRVVFCDTDGQERFGTLTTALYKSLNGCVLVFSRTNPVCFPYLPHPLSLPPPPALFALC